MHSSVAKLYKGKQEIPLESFVNKENQHLATSDAIDLLKQMFLYDHAERITAYEAMSHPFFDSIK